MTRGQGPRSPVLPALSRKDALVSVLRDHILLGRLPAGTRLNLDVIAETYGVSRMPVRDALKQLENEGLVVFHPYRSVEVTSLGPDDIEEIFGIRIELEKLAIGRAIDRLTAADLDRMRGIVERMDQTTDRDAIWVELNRQFHEVIHGACGWPRLIDLLRVLRANVERYVWAHREALGVQRQQRGHREILEACEQRDRDWARSLICEHLSACARDLCRALEGASDAWSGRDASRPAFAAASRLETGQE